MHSKPKAFVLKYFFLPDSGITIEDADFDGPVLQIIYRNNVISK